MKNIWIVVANSTMAIIYAFSKADPHFRLIKNLNHPESKLKEIDLRADQPGHNQKGTYEPPTSAKELEIELFAKELCHELEHGRVSYAYKAVIILAAPHFYGRIKKFSSHQVQKIIRFHLAKDYNHLSEHELKIKLNETLSDVLKSILIEIE